MPWPKVPGKWRFVWTGIKESEVKAVPVQLLGGAVSGGVPRDRAAAAQAAVASGCGAAEVVAEEDVVVLTGSVAVRKRSSRLSAWV